MVFEFTRSAGTEARTFVVELAYWVNEQSHQNGDPPAVARTLSYISPDVVEDAVVYDAATEKVLLTSGAWIDHDIGLEAELAGNDPDYMRVNKQIDHESIIMKEAQDWWDRFSGPGAPPQDWWDRRANKSVPRSERARVRAAMRQTRRDRPERWSARVQNGHPPVFDARDHRYHPAAADPRFRLVAPGPLSDTGLSRAHIRGE